MIDMRPVKNGRPAGLSGDRRVDRRPYPRIHRGHVSRVCVRPDGGEEVAASSTTSGVVPELRETPERGSDVGGSSQDTSRVPDEAAEREKETSREQHIPWWRKMFGG